MTPNSRQQQPTKNPVYIITGPTASGKTEYAVRLAKRINGEIISADSRQVYKEMRIGTGAPVLQQGTYKGIRHHLIGIADPTKTYTAFHFQQDALRTINDIYRRGKTPIVVGGTGLWIRALKEGLNFQQTKPNVNMRKQFEKELTKNGLKNLVQKLKSFNRNIKIDFKNPRRVIRALEISLSKTRSNTNVIAEHPKQSANTNDRDGESPRLDTSITRNDDSFTFKTILLAPSNDTLNKRINRRVDQMMKSGLVEEVKRLLQKYKLTRSSQTRGSNRGMNQHTHTASNRRSSAGRFGHLTRDTIQINESKLKRIPALTGIGYREIIDYLQGNITLTEAVELIKLHTRQYAKRQLTWLKKYR